jgi:hypothetical protein
MVVLHLKKTEQDQFLFETTVGESNDRVIRALVRCVVHATLQTEVWNLRILLHNLALAAEQLAQHGPSRPEEERGLDEVR